MTEKFVKPGVRFGEALLIALLFLTFILVFGLTTGRLNFDQWPPQVEMKPGFWLPVILSSTVYLYVLMNLHMGRQGKWKWYREGLITAIIIVVIWWIMAPSYQESIGMTERHKVGLP